jgi:hypothetical protein
MSEFRREDYRRLNTVASTGCPKVRETILGAIGKSNRREIIERFIVENCRGCGEPDAVIYDSLGDEVYVRKDSKCANSPPAPIEFPARRSAIVRGEETFDSTLDDPEDFDSPY